MATLHNIKTDLEARYAILALTGFLSKPDFPQHTNLGKANGGMAKVDNLEFWVWRTKTGWNAEYISHKEDVETYPFAGKRI